MARKTKYTAKDIEVLEPLEGVRARPGMYIGSTDEFGLLQIVKEIFDNGVDEALAGHCDHITIDLSSKGCIKVSDNGRGIPVEKHPKHPKKSTMEIIFTHLHAGGKLSKDGAYDRGSVGTHGVGASVTNALSKDFMVYTKRGKNWWSQNYSRGKPTNKVSKVKGKLTIKQGTLIIFTPDKKIFGKAKLPVDDLKNLLELSAYLHPKCTFELISPEGKSTKFKQPKGVQALLKKMIKRTKADPIGKPLIIQQSGLDVVLQWTSHTDENINSYVCGSPTKQGGTHMRGFAKALNEAIKPYKPKRGGAFKPEDLRVGLQGVINLTIAAPEFEGQTKGKLSTKEALDIVYKAVFPEMKKFFAKNKKLVRDLIKRAQELAAGRQKFVADRKLITALKTKRRGTSLLPAKLTQSTTRKAKERELFLVEGDSACFVGETKILCADGQSRTFQQLVYDHGQGIDHRGIAWNASKGNFVEFTIEFPRITKMENELVEIELETGEKIKCTPDHRFLLVSGKYKEAQDLTPEDEIRAYNKFLHIKKIRKIQLKEPVPVYDLTSPRHHNFVLENGCVVHNSGTSKMARNPKYQEILALRGKIINVYKDRKQKVFTNQEVLDILKSIGFDPSVKDPMLNLRVGKIILLSDPDVDGKHINVLLLSLLQRVLPELFEQGVVYVADAPLYNAYYRGTRYFAGSRKELVKKAPKGLKAEHIQRIKGWGEVNAPVLEDVAFNPKTRTLTRVTPLSARRLPKFEALVGQGTQFRKELLGLD